MERFKFVESYTQYTTHCQVYMCQTTGAEIRTSGGGNRMGAGYPSSPGRWVRVIAPESMKGQDEKAINAFERKIEVEFTEWIEAKKAVAS